ncbi:MAG: GntR family transcriptional regulator [Actinomycetota bacterium]|nr:GntR family transcriptional regulator [Actinomycetota bacterium]MDQ2955758.1 GntR family transcriptional regulator [Actinomycetota bacterium]
MAEAARSSKEQRAYETIRARIVDGTYGPGVRLVFDQLARDLKVSAVPVREAIRRLEAEGWITYQRNIGAQVATVDLAQYRNAMESLALLEGYATAAAVPYLSEAILAEAHAINHRLRASLEDFDPLGFTRLNHEFHVLLCQQCPNVHLQGLLEREWHRLNLVRRSTFSLVPGRARESVEEHDGLLRLIASGAEAAVVERAAREHKLNTLRAVSAQS